MIGCFRNLTTISFCVLMSATGTAMGLDFIPYPELAGTIWLSQQPHTRTAVDTKGNIEHKEGKDIYVKFLALKDGVYSIAIHWWNESAKINVMEYGVLVKSAENSYTYIEADHPDDSGFPGIAGTGTFELLDASTAQFSQLGRLLDGSASAFVNRLHKVSEAPTVEIPQTYPKKAE